MANIDHDGVIDASKAYSHKAIARILGRDEKWVISEIIRDPSNKECRVKHRRLGSLYMVSGHELILWIERTSIECHDEDK